jgi:hypothetical protein
MELEKGKTADRKGTVKAVWQKTGMALKKKKQRTHKRTKSNSFLDADRGAICWSV